MRKLATIVLSVILVFTMTMPVFAMKIPGEPIDPSKAFDKDYLTRTFTFDGKEYPDISVVTKEYGTYYVKWFSTDMIEADMKRDPEFYSLEGQVMLLSDDESRKEAMEVFVGSSVPKMMFDYPNVEIISIGGVPWQLTEYKDWLAEGVHSGLQPGDDLYDKDGVFWKWFMDPHNNGTGAARFKDTAKWIRPELGVKDDISMYNPLNNGKPVQIPDDKDTSAKDSTPKPVEAPDPPEGLEDGIVMQLGSPLVNIVKDGISKANTLSITPEAPNGYTLVPLRGVIDELGAKLEYNGEDNTVIITMGGKSQITLTINSDKAVVDGSEVTLGQPAVIKDGRILVPLRFVGEQLGLKVEFNDGRITMAEP